VTQEATGLSSTTYAELKEIAARYPQPRSGLLPMLHLVQASEGRITPEGIEACAEILGITAAEVSGVATFYTMYKRRPVGDYHVGVCTNTLCAVMGGDEIWESVSEHLGVGHDETTADGKITLERIECNAACDYAPVVMANWEFFDNQTPESTNRLVDDLRSGVPVVPSRGAGRVCDFRQVSRVLAGFPDGRADEGPGAGPASLQGLRLARARGWTAPASEQAEQAEQAEQHDTDTSGRVADTGGLEPGRQSSTDSPANDPDETPAGGEDKA
jgi:NADH-quinone oxidoreductase subunit E